MFGRLRRQADRGDGEYAIRRYRAGDRDELLSLYRDVLDPELGEAWFEWKYERNPYTDEVQVFVAEHDGAVVGAGGFWLLELHTGSRRTRVVQPCDAAVRPEHRREGLFTRIMGAGLDHLRRQGVKIAFDFPNELSRATFEKYGWRQVQRHETFYRIQRPGELLAEPLRSRSPLSDGNTDRVAAGVDGVTRLLARGLLAANAVRRPALADAPEVTIRRTDAVPAETLAALYRRDVPDAFHVVRDETFYAWRYGNPQWEYETYVGRYDGTPIAAVVTATTVEDGARITRLADVAPLAPSDSRAAMGRHLLEAVLEAEREAAIVAAPKGLLSRGMLASYGFRSTLAAPLSLLSTPTVHGVCSLTDDPDGDWVVDGNRLADPDAWRITFSEYDTG